MLTTNKFNETTNTTKGFANIYNMDNKTHSKTVRKLGSVKDNTSSVMHNE